jgi:UDP-N-acetylglucosamine 2-epimerase (non-hydrolysing)
MLRYFALNSPPRVSSWKCSTCLFTDQCLCRADRMVCVNHILHVVGARPNLIKAAPVLRAIRQRGIRQTLVHTGQHYDRNMSDVFFAQLEIPEPDFNLGVGSGSHATQTAQVMLRLEPVVLECKPDITVVYGDVNSTVAAALVCSKLLVPVAHVEAGLRSFDRTMPEEVNRMVTDRLSDVLFTPSEDGDTNLLNEGVPKERIHFVGNIMIDSLVRLLPAARNCPTDRVPERFALVTLHRPSNVDDVETLRGILDSLTKVSKDMKIIFPVHPRTRKRISEFGINSQNLQLRDPMPYIEFLALQCRAAVVITDSGGIQEETTYLGVPCLTLRRNTERPITVTAGTNILVGDDRASLATELGKILEGNSKKGSTPPLWDGRTGDRIADILQRM